MIPDLRQAWKRGVSRKFSGAPSGRLKRIRKTCRHPGQQKRKVSSPILPATPDLPRGSPQRWQLPEDLPGGEREEGFKDSDKIFGPFEDEDESHDHDRYSSNPLSDKT
jgi:hypothetical protein